MTAFERELVENGCEMQDMVKRLQKENAELRECLKDVLAKYGDHIYSETLEKCKAALEGGNHAND